MAKECCKRVNKAMSDYFGDEFMRLPTGDDLKGLVALQKRDAWSSSWRVWFSRLHAYYILEELPCGMATDRLSDEPVADRPGTTTTTIHDRLQITQQQTMRYFKKAL